jgi:hypothetical protein
MMIAQEITVLITYAVNLPHKTVLLKLQMEIAVPVIQNVNQGFALMIFVMEI